MWKRVGVGLVIVPPPMQEMWSSYEESKESSTFSDFTSIALAKLLACRYCRATGLLSDRLKYRPLNDTQHP